MISSFSSESDLKSLVLVLLQAESSSYSTKILADEGAIFQIASSLADCESSKLKVKLSFCSLILLIAGWKNSGCELDLPPILYHYFKVVNGFIYFSSTNETKEELFKSYSNGLQEMSKDKENLLLFVPDKFLREKRLYRIQKADFERICKTGSWSKLPDPHNCKSWIQLPPNFEKVKNIQLLTRKFSQELLAEVDHTEESVAKNIIIRNHRAQRSPSLISDLSPSKTSLFKRRNESIHGEKLKSDFFNTPIGISHYDFDSSPTLKRIDVEIPAKRTLTTKSTKITENASAALKKSVSFQLCSDHSESMNLALKAVVSNEELPSDRRPHRNLKEYTLKIGHKRMFPSY